MRMCECARCGDCAEMWALRAGVLSQRRIPWFVASFCDARAAIARAREIATAAGAPWPWTLDLHVFGLPPSSACVAVYDRPERSHAIEIGWDQAVLGPRALLEFVSRAGKEVDSRVSADELNAQNITTGTFS